MISEKFGFGQRNFIKRVSDANVDTTTYGSGEGIYQVNIVDSSSKNIPTSNWYFLYTFSGTASGSDYAVQIALGMTTERIYYRRKVVGTWQAWSQIQFVQ